jgi:hypothetical protein
VRTLGARTIIDYTTEDVVAAIRAQFPAGVPKIRKGVSGRLADRERCGWS